MPLSVPRVALLLALGTGAALVVNYLADRLYADQPRWEPYCPQCGVTLSWHTYALGLRACPQCGGRRWRPWMVLAVMVVGTVLCAVHPPVIGFFAAWLFFVYSVFNTVLDVEHRVLSPPVEALAALLALVFGVVRRGWMHTLLGLAVAVFLTGLFYGLGRVVGPWLARRGMGVAEEPAFGFGDVLLSGVLGLFLGWPAVLGALVAGVLFGGVVALVFLVARGLGLSRSEYLPYAPFLLLGAWWMLYLA